MDGDAVLDAVIRLAQRDHISTVILVSYWDNSDFEPWFEPTLRKTLDRLTHAGLRCVILGDTPVMDGTSVANWRRRTARGLIATDLTDRLSDYQQRTARSRALFSRLDAAGAVVFLDPSTYFIEGNPELIRGNLDGVLLYRDRDHLSPAGARRLRPLLEPCIRDAAETVQRRHWPTKMTEPTNSIPVPRTSDDTPSTR